MKIFGKTYLLIIWCCTFFSSCKNVDKKNNTEEKSSASITSAHINIPGTHIFIVPPAGFTPSTGSMKGFIKDETTTFLSVSEFKGQSFKSETKKNSVEKMRQQGLSIFTEQEKKVGPYNGRLMRIGDGETSSIWQLVFGNDSFAVMIMGIYPPHDELSGKQIAEALETVVYDKDMVVDEMAGMNYSVKPNESKFQYVKIQAGFAFYSLEGQADLKNDATPYLVVSQVPRANDSPQSFAETSLEAILRNGFTNPVIKSKGFLTINDNSAYEMEVVCTLKGRPVTVYIVVIVKDNIAIMVQGVAKNNIEATLAGFKQFADAIEIK